MKYLYTDDGRMNALCAVLIELLVFGGLYGGAHWLSTGFGILVVCFNLACATACALDKEYAE